MWKRILGIACLALAIGCSADIESGGAEGLTTTPSSGRVSVDGGSPTSPSTVVIDPDARAKAEAAIGAVRADLPFRDDVVACSIDVIASDPALVAAVLEGVDQDSDGYAAVLEAGQ